MVLKITHTGITKTAIFESFLNYQHHANFLFLIQLLIYFSLQYYEMSVL